MHIASTDHRYKKAGTYGFIVSLSTFDVIANRRIYNAILCSRVQRLRLSIFAGRGVAREIECSNTANYGESEARDKCSPPIDSCYCFG